MKKTIYLVRHGQPVTHGSIKYGLDQVGRAQVQNLADCLKSQKLTRPLLILHSPTLRCQETADTLGLALDCRVEKADLRLKGVDSLRSLPLMSKYSLYMDNYRRLKIESPEAYFKRIKSLLDGLRQGDIMLVIHEVNIKILLGRLSNDNKDRKVRHASCFRVILNSKTIGTVKDIK